ncbi:hypothetical protein ACJW30_05G046000 [Castanea mollissima]
MASISALFCTCMMMMTVMLVTTSAPVEAVKEFEVGGDMGWVLPDANNSATYNQWASRKRFHIGDSLSFEYQNDSVLVVDKWDYYHCNTTEPITSFSNGKSVIQLDRSGPFYFISGDTDHCKHGQRLIVEVMSMHMHHIPPSPPSIAFPPGSDTGIAPASSAISTAPAPSPSSGIQVSATLDSVFMSLIAISVIFLWFEP